MGIVVAIVNIIDHLEEKEVFILDCDGVLYRGNEAIPGSKKAIEALKRHGKTVKFLTNYPYSREEVREKLKTLLQISIPKEDIMTVAFAVSEYIKENKSNEEETAYVFGFENLKKEIRKSGVKILKTKEIVDDYVLLELPNWVVISLYEGTDYYLSLTAAGLILRDERFNPVHYITTSKGKGWTREKGISPGIGCTIAALREFSGKEPITIGKPSNKLMELALKQWKIEPKKTALIGDKWSDIEVANEYGFYSVKVETGKQDFFSGIEKIEQTKRPKLVIGSLSGILNPKEIYYFER